MGALGVALGTMVANLSSHKKGWDERWKEFSDWAEKGKKIQNDLLNLVDEDTLAYKGIMNAYALPKDTDEEKRTRKMMIDEAVRNATIVPLRVMQTALPAYEIIQEMVVKGNPNSITDAAVGALALRSCIKGAAMNVRINLVSVEEGEFKQKTLDESAGIEAKAVEKETEILYIVNSSIEKMAEKKK